MVRHAKAGDRADREGDDRLRPLSRGGRRQAEGLVDQLKKFKLDRVLSSPYTRCLETVEPLASRRKLEVGETDRLAEGAGLNSLLGLFEELSGREAVLCTHGDIVWELLDHLQETGVLKGRSPAFQKGSTWIVQCEAGQLKAAHYLPPP